MSTTTHDINSVAADVRRFAPLFQAYLECSDELQAHAQNLFKAIADPQTEEDDRALAAMTLADVLFPVLYEGELGSDLEECEEMAKHTAESRETLERMDQEEAIFADRLRSV